MEALWAAGWKMSAEGANELEARLVEDPDDVDARIKLLGYYRGKRDHRQVAHALWFVEHRPENQVWLLLDVVADELSEAWRRVIAARPNDTRLLEHAGRYFARADVAFAEQLLQRGAELESGVAHWHATLAAIGVTPVVELGLAVALASSEELRFGYVLDAARAASDANDTILARYYAERVLAEDAAAVGTWNHGNGLHHANIILGKLALASGDVAGAKERLLASTRGPSSPQLSSFGPDQALALALLERGEREAVVAYVEACKNAFGVGLGLLGALNRGEPAQLRLIK